jgi:predicted secreted protein
MPGLAPALLVLALATPSAVKPTPLPSLPPAMMKTTMPSYTASDTGVSVKAGAPFQIRLKVTSGTGYSWQPQGPLPPGVTLLGVFQTPRGKMMPGGPGEEVLVFRASGVGTLHLTMEYVRPWQRGVKPAKVQTFLISVHK